MLGDSNDLAGSIDLEIFGQILEMDDDDDDKEDRGFSRAIVYGFLEQAEDAFQNMKESLYVFLNPSYPSRRRYIYYC